MPLTCILTVRQQRHIRQGYLYLDVRPEYRQLRRNLHVLHLPLRQFKFMQCLMANHPKPMTHWEMFYWVWGEGTRNRWGEPVCTDEDGGPLVANSCIEQLAAKLRIKLAPLGLMIHAPRKGYGYEIKEVEEAQGKAPAADSSSQKAEGEVRPEAADEGHVVEASRDPRGSKAGVPRKQVLLPTAGDDPSGITLTIEPVRVRR